MLYGNSSCSQQNSNRVNSKVIGVSFVIPEGWFGQETRDGYMLKSNTMAGFILINKNNTSDINTMFYEAQQGLVNDNLNYLQLVGNVENFNNTGVGVEYNGKMEGVSTKAYMVGVLNNMGLGVSIMAATTPEYYSSTYRQLCIDIASSVSNIQNTETHKVAKVNQSVKARKVNQSEELFAGARLTYYNTGDGYSTKITIDLCEQGFFHHSFYDSVKVAGEGFTGGYTDDNSGAGSWSVVENTNQNSILRLKFHNGKVFEYYITSSNDEETYLDNKRYFREYGKYGARWCN